jgi:hypothetical protein
MEKRNVHLIKTDEPTGIFESNTGLQFSIRDKVRVEPLKGFHIYITDDSKIQEGDYGIGFAHGIRGVGRGYYVFKQDGTSSGKLNALCEGSKKVIMTTDPNLAPDVQKIDDDFLEWFVAHPSCEYIQTTELSLFNGDTGESGHYKYEIIIPQAEAKLDLEKEMFDLEQELGIPSNLRWHNSKPKQEDIFEEAKSALREYILANKEKVTEDLQEMRDQCQEESKWDKLNEELDNALDSMTPEQWDIWKVRFMESQKQEVLTYSELAKKEERVFNSTLTEQEAVKRERKHTSEYPYLYRVGYHQGSIDGAKRQAEKSYSEEDVLDLLYKRDLYLLNRYEEIELELPEDWLKQIKNK